MKNQTLPFVQRPVLVLYKKSAYSYYKRLNLCRELDRFRRAHREHLQTMAVIEKVLRRYGITYKKYVRGQEIPYQNYDLVITVGGDGTFLEAARNLKDQLVLGVNSAPASSLGKLCAATAQNFEQILQRIIAGRFKIEAWQRLYLKIDDSAHAVECLNDILVCHNNPAAVSRYYLEIGKIREEQRSSGLWVATAAGSSGAICSAGGKVLKITGKKLQYMPRELYRGKHIPFYRLKGGVLNPGQTITVISLMREGMVFVDGTHAPLEFPFNATLTVGLSPNPVRVIRT